MTTARSAGKAKRDRLTRERILRAAVEHADSYGLSSVTIRSLAADLGVHPMSLYHYVAGKDAILEAMIDVLLEEAPMVEVATWQEWVAAVFASMRALARAHPGAIEVIQSSPASGRNAALYSEYGLRCFLAAGFSEVEAVTAVRSVSLAALGLSANERVRALRTREELTARTERSRQSLHVDASADELVDLDLWGFTLTTLVAGLEAAVWTRIPHPPDARRRTDD